MIKFITKLIKTTKNQLILATFRKHLWFILFVTLYIILLLSQIDMGIPNNAHPFMYNMDEWHGFKSVKEVFQVGTTNLYGISAYGSIFFYFTTGLYLIPFILLHLNLFSLKSSLDNLALQHQLFEVLRFNTILYGILAIYLLTKIVKKYFNWHAWVSTALFIASPIFLILSGYFKYDIAVTSWILITIYSFLLYIEKQTKTNLFLVAIVSALTIAIKISALPILPIFVFSLLLFTKRPQKQIRLLASAIGIFIITLFIFGFPDLLVKKDAFKGYYLLLEVITAPEQSSGFFLNMPVWMYLITTDFPTIFGYFNYFSFIVSLVYWIFTITKSFYQKKADIYKKEIFILISLTFFLLSILPLQMGAAGNRALVLLPFIIIVLSMTFKHILKNKSFKWQTSLFILCCFGILLQVLQTYTWFSVKYVTDPRITSSIWIQKNIPYGASIGIENIPIYEMLPDTTVKEFYEKQYSPLAKTIFNNEVIYAQTPTYAFPKYIIITNEDMLAYQTMSSKKELLAKMKELHYKNIMTFNTDLTSYKYLGKEREFYLSGLMFMPSSVRIFKKE